MTTVSHWVNIVSTTITTLDTAQFYLGNSPFGVWANVAVGWIVNGRGCTNAVVAAITRSADANPRTVTIRVTGGTFSVEDTYIVSTPAVACFVEGTNILTPNGYKAVETLSEDVDLVKTCDHRSVSFKLIKTTLQYTTVWTAPFLIKKGAFGANVPCNDLRLSGTHKVQVSKGTWMSPEIAAVSNPHVQQYGVGEPVTYYHIECPNYMQDNVIAEGVVAESFGTLESTHGMTDIYAWNSTMNGLTRKDCDFIKI